MTLKSVTYYAMVGIFVAFCASLLKVPWHGLAYAQPRVWLDLMSNVFLHGALLFFLYHLHRRS